MRWILYPLACLALLACRKEEQPEPKAPEPVYRSVRYQANSLGAFLFTFRINDVGGNAPVIGDTTRTLSLQPGTRIALATDLSSAPVTARIWVDDVLIHDVGANTGMWINLVDTIR